MLLMALAIANGNKILKMEKKQAFYGDMEDEVDYSDARPPWRAAGLADTYSCDEIKGKFMALQPL